MTDLSRGYIATADLPMGATRVDIQQRDVLAAAATAERRRPIPRPESFGVNRRTQPHDSARTVYLTLPRPKGLLLHERWTQLASAVRATVRPYLVLETATAVDHPEPALLWVLLVNASQVVDLQARVVSALAAEPGRAASVIWTEGVPRSIYARGK